MDTCGHVGWQITTQKKQQTKTAKGETQIPQPDMRFAIQQRNKAKSERGRAQQNNHNQDCHGHSGEKSLCRNSQKDSLNELVAARKVKHASELLLLTDNKGKD